ncbi:hypothetical protein [Microbacterium sp. CH12i]|uniref:hypothetical protein n=1 Tax=Microbacterium sp. CH12i TaxID=1479651 RepID=UPI000B1E6572|nr:hypothetical protein [Microbacterium sp. CH12i]
MSRRTELRDTPSGCLRVYRAEESFDISGAHLANLAYEIVYFLERRVYGDDITEAVKAEIHLGRKLIDALVHQR